MFCGKIDIDKLRGKNMKFKQIKIKNFKSIGEATIDLDNRGLILVDGINKLPTASLDKNGTGKSTWSSAIFYAIYGELPNGDKADMVINNNVGKNTLVELYFETPAGDFIIKRGRKKNILELVSDEKDISKGTNKETQADIDKIIGIPKDVFLSTLYFDGHNSQPFSTLTDKQRKEYLETLFDVGIYRDAHEQTKLDISEKNNHINYINNEISNFNAALAPLMANLEQIKENDLKYNDTRKKLQDKVETLSSDFELMSKNHQLSLDSLETEINKTNLEIKNLESFDTDALTNIENELADKKYKLAFLNNELSSSKKSIDNLKDKLISLSQTEICPVCGNPIDEDHKKRESDNIKQLILAEVKKYKEYSVSIGTYSDEIAPLESEVLSKKSIYANINTQYQQLNAKISKYRLQQNAITGEISNEKYEVDKAKSELDMFEKNGNTFSNHKKDINSKIMDTKNSILVKNKELEKEQKELASLQEALKAFSDKGIKSHVLDLVTPEMNNTIQGYLSFLTGGTITVHFSTQSVKANGETTDKFDIQVTNNGKETTYSALSSGEQRRLDLSISLTLQDILMRKSNTKSNLLIYDELFESLDGVGSENVIELLKQRLNSVSSIFVVTHNETLKPLFENTMTVVKNSDGMSYIEGGEK